MPRIELRVGTLLGLEEVGERGFSLLAVLLFGESLDLAPDALLCPCKVDHGRVHPIAMRSPLVAAEVDVDGTQRGQDLRLPAKQWLRDVTGLRTYSPCLQAVHCLAGRVALATRRKSIGCRGRGHMLWHCWHQASKSRPVSSGGRGNAASLPASIFTSPAASTTSFSRCSFSADARWSNWSGKKSCAEPRAGHALRPRGSEPSPRRAKVLKP